MLTCYVDFLFQRLIVEFSLENRKALETKEKRKERAKVNITTVVAH